MYIKEASRISHLSYFNSSFLGSQRISGLDSRTFITVGRARFRSGIEGWSFAGLDLRRATNLGARLAAREGK